MAYRPGTNASEDLYGTTSNDYFLISLGNDNYFADTGIDTLSGSNLTTGVWISAFRSYENSFTFAEIGGAVGNYAFYSNGKDFETLKLTDFDDYIDGDFFRTDYAYDLTVYSFGGNDTIIMEAGNDTIYAGQGQDIVLAGFGNDTVFGGKGADQLNGYFGNDIIYGQSGDDVIGGNGGADELYGGANQDTIRFDADDLVIDGGGGWDIGEAEGSVGVSLDLASANIEEVYGTTASDIFDASGVITLTKIYGEGGNDTLTGGSGADRFYGGEGDDMMTGNSGNDRFYFATDWGQDIVTDYDANGNNDRLDVSAAGITSFSEFTESTNGTDTILTLNVDPNQTITLLNTDPNTINQWDFIFCIGSCDQMDDSMIFSDQNRPDIPEFDFAELSTPASESEAILDELDMFGLSLSVLSPFQTDVFDASDMGLWDMF